MTNKKTKTKTKTKTKSESVQWRSEVGVEAQFRPHKLIFYLRQNPPSAAFSTTTIGIANKGKEGKPLTNGLSGLHLCLDILPGSSTWGPS